MSNFNSASAFAIAQTEVNAHLQQQVERIAPEPKRQVTQRKAHYHDKSRTRKKDIQFWVFRRTGLSTTKQVKHYLKKLGHKGDGRLTSFWLNVNLNYALQIAVLVKADWHLEPVTIATTIFKKGDRVLILEYPPRLAHLESMAPYVVRDIVEPGKAALDFCNFLVDLNNLQLVS